MSPDRFERLTRAQRECLRLYNQRYRVKTMAEMMGGISPNTVSSYLSEAVAVLGAAGRAAAATALAEWESAHPEARGRFSAGDIPPPVHVIAVPTEDPPPQPVRPWQAYLPFRTAKGTPSDLHPLTRLFWIVAIALLAAIGFGQLAVAARVLTDLASRAYR
jgi:DNA-binding CsgD family transcriptional regulator